MREILLRNSAETTLVDDDDYDFYHRFDFVGTKKGYAVFRRGLSRGLRLHRLIANPPKGLVVDHINGNRLDNRRKNLRVCTSAQNAVNRIKSDYETHMSGSRFHGVQHISNYWLRPLKPWVGFMKTKDCGAESRFFSSEEEAARWADSIALDRWGEYAKLNFPPPGWPPPPTVPDIPCPDH